VTIEEKKQKQEVRKRFGSDDDDRWEMKREENSQLLAVKRCLPFLLRFKKRASVQLPVCCIKF
jgi:hypothetical protein